MKPDELRKRREDTAVEIRKQKKDESLAKRRNLVIATEDSGDDSGMTIMSLSYQASDAEIDNANIQVLSDLPLMIQYVLGGTEEQQLEATQKFRKLLSKERNPPIEQGKSNHDLLTQVISCGVVPQFVNFLRSPNPLLQFEAAWV